MKRLASLWRPKAFPIFPALAHPARDGSLFDDFDRRPNCSYFSIRISCRSASVYSTKTCILCLSLGEANGFTGVFNASWTPLSRCLPPQQPGGLWAEHRSAHSRAGISYWPLKIPRSYRTLGSRQQGHGHFMEAANPCGNESYRFWLLFLGFPFSWEATAGYEEICKPRQTGKLHGWGKTRMLVDVHVIRLPAERVQNTTLPRGLIVKPGLLWNTSLCIALDGHREIFFHASWPAWSSKVWKTSNMYT